MRLAGLRAWRDLSSQLLLALKSHVICTNVSSTFFLSLTHTGNSRNNCTTSRSTCRSACCGFPRRTSRSWQGIPSAAQASESGATRPSANWFSLWCFGLLAFQYELLEATTGKDGNPNPDPHNFSVRISRKLLFLLGTFFRFYSLHSPRYM